MKVLHENGWLSRKIKYFTGNICHHCMFYKDESTDFMETSNIDGVQIISI